MEKYLNKLEGVALSIDRTINKPEPEESSRDDIYVFVG